MASSAMAPRRYDVKGARRLQIDITSDVICPFCLIGVSQMERAIEQYNDSHPSAPITPSIRMLPFELAPNLSSIPMLRKEYRARKFGEERAESIAVAMRKKMKDAGFDQAEGGLISSTHDAHRLQTYALRRYPDRQYPLAMDLFRAYHAEGEHMSDMDVLAKAAVKNEIFSAEEEAKDWLEGDECDLEVRQSYMTARRLGITGVPFFVFQNKWAASGAMGVEPFVELLEEIIKREEAEASASPSPTATAVESGTEPAVKSVDLPENAA